jgi:hypothetical protein
VIASKADAYRDERALLDHLVGPRDQPIRHAKPERLGGLKVDHQVELRRLFTSPLAA